MDEFAQTREPDNLFEDDFTPIEKIVVVQPVNAHPPPQHHDRHGGRASKPSQTSPSTIAATTTAATIPAQPGNANSDQLPATRTSTAVRGDRSATGGINKPKLSESELSSRLAAAKLNNARREEAHRAAEADEASFQRREAEVSQKRREEGIVRKAMEREREKNRLRKLGARGGREWDEGKQEQDTSSSGRGGSQYRRGIYGGTAAYRGGGSGGGRERGELEESNGRQDDFGGHGYNSRGSGDRGRGGDRARGERGRGGGRGGRGRGAHEGGRRGGDYHQNSSYYPAVAPYLPTNTETDFPSLVPPTKNPHPGSRSEPVNSISTEQAENIPQSTNNTSNPDVEPFSPGEVKKQSWSDEVEEKTSNQQ